MTETTSLKWEKRSKSPLRIRPAKKIVPHWKNLAFHVQYFLLKLLSGELFVGKFIGINLELAMGKIGKSVYVEFITIKLYSNMPFAVKCLIVFLEIFFWDFFWLFSLSIDILIKSFNNPWCPKMISCLLSLISQPPYEGVFYSEFLAPLFYSKKF